jgi:hypothetical protein
MIVSLSHKQPTERDLAGLADGSLPVRRRARVERAVASSSKLQADLATERRALRAIRGVADERAPIALRARLELARDPDPRWRLPRFVTATAATAGVAVAGFAAAIAVTIGGATGAPTVAAAAGLANRAPVAVAAATPNDHGVVPGVTAAGISFPDWGPSFGFEPVGVRRDPLGDRQATTVFYARGDQQIAYTIMSGPPLPAGAKLSSSVWGGLRIGSFLRDGRVVVTWLRDGHTCVLSGAGTPSSLLARLASYKGADRFSDDTSAVSWTIAS